MIDVPMMEALAADLEAEYQRGKFDAAELKKEMQRVIACGWDMGRGQMRFSFRVSPETFARWQELVK